MNPNELIDKNLYFVKPISLKEARNIVEKFHYAKSATKTGVYTHGLFKKGEQNPIGVAWWLPPTKNAAIATYPEGCWKQVLSLTRLAIDDSAPKNSASFLLSKSIKLIDSTKWKCLVTYADTWRGHSGAIYKACNWQYMGKTKKSPVYVNEFGMMMGRKRGAKNLTSEEMKQIGLKKIGEFEKHKFRFILKNKPKKTFQNEETQQQLF